MRSSKRKPEQEGTVYSRIFSIPLKRSSAIAALTDVVHSMVTLPQTSVGTKESGSASNLAYGSPQHRLPV